MKKILSILAVIVLAVSVALAGYVASEYISIRLVMQNGSTQQFLNASTQHFYGGSSIRIGDSAYVSAGGITADTNAFSGALLSKAVYVPGANYGDIYFVSKRNIAGVSTSISDSCILSYMAKPDSLIVFRQPIGTTITSGQKFGWLRMKLQ